MQSFSRRWLAIRTLVFGLGLVVSSQAFAYDYRVPIRVQDENDLEELFLSGDLTEEERDQLLELYRARLDLNTANRDELYLLPGFSYDLVDRILAFRAEKPFTRVNDLVLVEGIDAAMIREVRPFTTAYRAYDKKAPKSPWRSRLRLRVVDEVNDPQDMLPEGYARAEVKYAGKWSAGALVMVHNSLDSLEYRDVAKGDPVIPATHSENGNLKSSPEDLEWYLYTPGRNVAPTWPKLYVALKEDTYRFLLGSYRIGFGQKLVLDNTGRVNPDGFEPDLQVYEGWEGFSLSKGFFGAAGSMRNLIVGPVDVDVTGFFSWWKYDAYQYDLKHEVEYDEEPYETYKILTPHQDIFYRTLDQESLPEAWSELMGGGNVSVKLGKGVKWGVTGYASTVDFHLGDPSTVFARSSPFPMRTTFGAAGSDLAWQWGPWHAWAEGAVVDSGGYAGIARAMYDLKPLSVELLYRYYAQDFDNPHSRGYNMPDEWYGDRDRGENGARATIRYRFTKQLWVRLDTDIWRAAQELETDLGIKTIQPWRMENFARVDWRVWKWLQLGVFAQFNDRDLDASGRDEEYSSGSLKNPAKGEKWAFGANTSLDFARNSTFWLYYKISLYDAALEDASYQKDHYVTAKISSRPLPWLRVQGRAKYLKGELETLDGATREHFLEAYAQLGVLPKKGLEISIKGLVRDFYDSDNETEWFWRLGADWSF